MRNGNDAMSKIPDKHDRVLTVPMRNGNSILGITSPWYSSSYRTYEEWKLLNSILSIVWSMVLTVPMRNGNTNTKPYLQDSLTMFLPYL